MAEECGHRSTYETEEIFVSPHRIVKSVITKCSDCQKELHMKNEEQ